MEGNEIQEVAIHHNLNNLDKELQRLLEMANLMAERLSCVLGPHRPEPGDEAKQSIPEESPIASQVRDFTNRACNIRNILGDLLDRLEI